tara:strand:- start:1279 stop:1818 length:540 start_codon:yes stop_codon:yes gene_type:complete
MAQFARPTGDKTDDGNWSTTDVGSGTFYTEIDESSASDTDYITGDGTMGSEIEIDFDLTNGLADPGVTTGHKLIYRYNTDGGSSDATLTVKLMEGSTVRMQEALDVSGVSSYTTRTYAPTNTTGTISSYDNLFLRINFNDGDAMDSIYVSQAYLEIPDGVAGSDAVPMALNTYQQMRNK